MNAKEIRNEARRIKAQTEVTAKTVLSEATIAMIAKAKNKYGTSPYLDVRDGILAFRVTYVTYNGNNFIAQGVVWPRGEVEKAANFLYRSSGQLAAYNISSIMERRSKRFNHERKVYQIKKLVNPNLPYPMWVTPISDMVVDDTFIVKAKHYKGYLQLDFATWRFANEL